MSFKYYSLEFRYYQHAAKISELKNTDTASVKKSRYDMLKKDKFPIPHFPIPPTEKDFVENDFLAPI